MSEVRLSIPSQPDFELGINRTNNVAIIAEVPETEIADGLVFLIPGMGGENDASYSTMLRRYLATKHNLVAVSVDGHCNNCRPLSSQEFGSVTLDIEKNSIIDALGKYVVNNLGHPLKLEVETHNDVLALLQGDVSHQYSLKAHLTPPGNQYQNFGVLAALDHIAALHHLIDTGLAFDTSNVLCLGSSHGGYIAHLMAKFAPNTINAVIDASAYTETVTKFVDNGFCEAAISDGNLLYDCSTTQGWQFRLPGRDDFFGPDRALIRDAAYRDHLEIDKQMADRRCQFRMIHSEEDSVSSPLLKRAQADLLQSNGYDAVLKIVKPTDVDGKFIKSVDHGMGIALNALFDHFYPTIERRPGKIDRELATELTFPCPKRRYVLKYDPASIHVKAECPLHSNAREAEQVRALAG
ncbi:MAG: DUF2920 family protein [Parvibaculum sp.]